MNTLFTGEYDQVLLPGSGAAKVVDHEMGIKLDTKPVTELDRLAYVISKISENVAAPKNAFKLVPAGKLEFNEGFKGLSAEDSMRLENWRFIREPKDPEVLGLYEREEATFSEQCLDQVNKDYPHKAWSIHSDVTSTVATLKSHLWPGLYSYHRCNTQSYGYIYIGDGISNADLPFMV